MYRVRASRGATVVAVVVWQLAALVLLPAALCCHAAVTHGDAEEVPACCKGAHDGAACPMSRRPGAGHAAGHAPGMDHGTAHASGGHAAEADRGEAGDAAPRMHGCHLLDETLLALAGLAGLRPETFRLAGDPAAAERVADTRGSLISLHAPPATPPPRV